LKAISWLAKVDFDKCTGYKTCEKVCPVLAIKVEKRKAVVNSDMCRGCANCEQRCPFGAIEMIKREKPFDVFVDVSDVDYNEVEEICTKARLHPEQIICYCTATRAEEVAAAILKGAELLKKFP